MHGELYVLNAHLQFGNNSVWYNFLHIGYSSMIKDIIDLLQISDFYHESEEIDIAKGKYQIPLTWKEVKNLFKRM